MKQEAEKNNTCVYIDGANLHRGVDTLGWSLDYKRFNIWLREKYKAGKIYLFLGLIPKYKNLYTFLQESGYTLIFKETTYDNNGKAKGNCDADLVLKSVIDYYEKKLDKAVFVSSDGDFAGLIAFFRDKKVLKTVISPSNNCSFLLRKLNIPIVYLETQKNHLLQKAGKEKAPNTDGTVSGSFS